MADLAATPSQRSEFDFCQRPVNLLSAPREDSLEFLLVLGALPVILPFCTTCVPCDFVLGFAQKRKTCTPVRNQARTTDAKCIPCAVKSGTLLHPNIPTIIVHEPEIGSGSHPLRMTTARSQNPNKILTSQKSNIYPEREIIEGIRIAPVPFGSVHMPSGFHSLGFWFTTLRETNPS